MKDDQRLVKSLTEIAWEATWKLAVSESGVVSKSSASENILLTNSISAQDYSWIDNRSRPKHIEMQEYTCTIYRPFKTETKDNPNIKPVRLANVINSLEPLKSIVRDAPNNSLDSLTVGQKLFITIGF